LSRIREDARNVRESSILPKDEGERMSDFPLDTIMSYREHSSGGSG